MDTQHKGFEVKDLPQGTAYNITISDSSWRDTLK